MTYRPAFTRYPPTIVNRLTRIAASAAVIDAARILPAQESELRRKARIGTIHYSTLIEGNELSVIEAERAVDKELEPTTRLKRELVNYVHALELIDHHHAAGTIRYSQEFVLELHATAMRGLGVAGAEFAPEHEGAWRPGIAVVGDRFGNVYHRAPPPADVPQLMADVCEYLEQKRVQSDHYPAAVLAGVAHYALTDVHPFADGNGRLARLLAVAVMLREGLMARRLFSVERHYAENTNAYYDALRSVRRNTNNMEKWLEYFTTGLADELERVAERVRDLNGLNMRVEQALQLNAKQEVAIAALTTGGRRELTRADYEELVGLRASAAKEDLARLVNAGVLRVVGAGRATRYRLAVARPAAAPTGRARRRHPHSKWTDERIRAELAEFLRDRDHWPPFAVFDAAGKAALYKAASRRGGIERWAAEFDR